MSDEESYNLFKNNAGEKMHLTFEDFTKIINRAIYAGN